MKVTYQTIGTHRFFLVFITFLLLLTPQLLAKLVDKPKAGKAADGFIVERYPAPDLKDALTVTKKGKSKLKVNKVTPLIVSNSTIGYVAELKPSGFILFSADDQAPPIKIYSDEGSFDNLPQGLLKILELELLEDNEYLKSKKPKDKVKLKKYSDLWTSLSSDNEDSGLSTSAADSAVLNTEWNQNDPYNYYCPTVASGGSGGRAYAGCTAAALGQILRHHNSPEQVASDHTYTDSSGCGIPEHTHPSCTGTHSISDAGMGSYDWANMPSAISTSSPEVQQQAVGQLLYHCAVALESNFESCGTSAFPTDVPEVLQTYFNYTSSNYQNKSSYTSAVWYDKIGDDIDDNQPIFYAMWQADNTGGHAVVCDGYRNGNEIHIDMGWSGAWTAWYNMDSVVASSYTWTKHGAVFEITPVGSSNPVLSNPQVSPTSGTESTNFKYTVHYYDADGDAPVMGGAKVYIDGQTELMILESGSPANGDYTFIDQLGLGYHNYSFAFINENGFDTTSTYYNVPYVHTAGCGIELKVEVSGGPVTNNIEIKFDYGTESQQWYAPELPQNVWIDPGLQLHFSAYLESNNHTFIKWESRDNSGNLLSESSNPNDSFILNSGNIHATAFLSYTPINYTISGTIHRDDGSAIPGGVDLTLTSSQQTLNQHIDSTSFSFTGIKGGVPVSITYEASDGGYAFSPPSLSYGNLESDHTSEDITAYSSDTSVPMTSFVMVPPAVSEDSSVTFSWTGEDDVTAPANLMYQYKLDSVDADWSLWTAGTSRVYDLANGEYTFWVRAKDEAENINQAPTNYTFVVNAAPRVISAERINRSVWASRLTMEMPSGASNPTDSFVLLPEHSGMSDTELVPVLIHRVDETTPYGASEIVASELGVTSTIVKCKSGWSVTLPESVPSGQTVQYDIVWGKIKYFGWQEFVSMPSGFPNGGSVQSAYLDDSLRTWRSAGRWEQHGSGVADDEGWIYMDSCNRNGIIIPETTMRYVRGESWGGDAGTRTKFENGRIFKSGSNMCYIWQDEKYEYDGSSDKNYRRYGLQILDDAGNTVNSADGTYYDRASHMLPTQLIHNQIWVVASQDIGSQWNDPDDAWFLVLNENGTEIKSKTVFDTFQNSNGSSLSAERAYGLGNNILLLWTKEWGTPESDGRSKIVYEVRNTSGTIVKDKTNLSPEPLPDSIEEDDEYWVENILSDNEGKVWISYSHDRSGQAYEYYYIIIGTDGNIWKGPIQTTGERWFNYCDKDGYIWATEDGQFFALNSNDTIAVPVRTGGWIPNQDVGSIAAGAGRLYDRWSPQTIQIDVPSDVTADTMKLYDLNLWDNDLHAADIVLKKESSTVWSQSGQFTGQADIHTSSVLYEGLNILTMTQNDFIGGQVLVTFPYAIPTVAGDFNNDRIVNLADLEILAIQWLGVPGEPSADIVRDHIVNMLDFSAFAENWGVDNRVSQKIVGYTLDSNPGWTCQGEWYFGQPAGLGGANGNPDPSSGYTGDNVYGVNPFGDYSITAGGPYYLTSGVIDCTGYSNVHLKFAQWLNTDFPPYASSKVEVSIDGTTWQTIWEHTDSRDITDDTWQQIDYDISAIADDQPTVYLRWSYQIGSGAYAYSGWNIDDIEVIGVK